MRRNKLLPLGDPHAGPDSTHAGILLLRVSAGLSLALAHGFGKLPPDGGFVGLVAEMGFPAPLFFAWAAALAESAGGMAIALGLFTRPAAVAVAATMFVAAFVLQAGDPFLERELAILYLAVALALFLLGPGRISLDALLRSSPARVAAPAAGGAD